ncbi:O-methyltransferase [Halobacillus sp. B29]|uniref:O-methyltransferase n=1 Tax=Halobacillus sp. B29 TaxID=3457432 RepID=UPI003FCC88A5
MSTQKTWTEVDDYFNSQLVQEKDAMNEVLKSNSEAGLPSIDVSAAQGKMLHVLAKIKGAKRILEVGTLGGYSSIWLASALPEDGRLVTLEASEKHAQAARKNIEHAGLKEKVEILLGPANETFPSLAETETDPFDFVFIDADKRNNPSYIKWAIDLSARGACIVVDNVVRHGEVVVKDSQDPDIEGIRDMFDILSNEPRIDSTAIQTVGSKGYDGFLLAVVK